jgi:drug/metabolite transporter (DMT)-like permease
MTLVKGAMSTVFLGAALFMVDWGTISPESLLLLSLSGILGIAVADTLFFAALQDLGPVALVVFFMVGQILTALMAICLLKEMPSLKAWAGILLTLSGIGAVLWKKFGSDTEARRSGLRGIILGALSMLCMSSSTVIAKPALESISTILATFLRMMTGTMSLFIFGLVTNHIGQWLRPVGNMQMISRFVFSVFVVTFGGFWLSLVAIKYVDVAVASTLSATEPLFVLPLAVVVFKERISKWELVGVLSATSGVLLLIR